MGDTELVIRPRDSFRVARLRPQLAVTLVSWTAVALGRVLLGPVPFLIWSVFVIGPGALVGRALYFARTNIRVTPDEVQVSGYFGVKGRCARASLARVVAVDSAYAAWAGSRAGAYSGIRLHFLGADGRTLVNANVRYYPPDELGRLREALGVPWEKGKDALERARREAAPAAPDEPFDKLEPFPRSSPPPEP